MSKIGKLPIAMKEGVTVTITDSVANVTGSKGTLTFRIPQGIAVSIDEGVILVSPVKADDTNSAALHGLTRALLANMVKGVSEGFEKKLELVGVGYRAQVAGQDLSVSVGFAHPVKVAASEGIMFAVKDNVISVSGINKEIVGNVAAEIRAIKPPEPYKGKGIKYVGEYIRRKAGKAAKAVGGK